MSHQAPPAPDHDLRPDQAAELMAFIDGALTPDRMARVQARLATDPELGDRARSWAQQRDLIARAARQADALPDRVPIRALEQALARRLKARRWRAFLIGPQLRQVVTGAALFAAGFATHALLIAPDRTGEGAPQARVAYHQD